jgi:hypothetical protein
MNDILFCVGLGCVVASLAALMIAIGSRCFFQARDL